MLEKKNNGYVLAFPTGKKSFYILHNVVCILHCTMKEMPKLKLSQSSS